MTVTLTLSTEVARLLKEKAARSGRTLESYLAQLAEREVRANDGLPPPDVSADEFDRLLDELAAGPTLPHLPDSFSRADIYADHD